MLGFNYIFSISIMPIGRTRNANQGDSAIYGLYRYVAGMVFKQFTLG